MAGDVVREARNALARLRRAVEKAERELGAVEGALRHAEGADFPEGEFGAATASLAAVAGFVEEQAERLEAKMLEAGGLEPGRIRRTGGVA